MIEIKISRGVIVSCAFINSLFINAQYDAGAGTIDQPYLVSNRAGVVAMAKNPNAHYKLTSDIDMNGGEDVSNYPFMDINLSFEERAADLVSRMTLDEMQSQMVHQAKAIPRLGVKAYNWWNEAAHGVARSGPATSFPAGLGFGAMWDTAFVRQIADVISDEARGYKAKNGQDLSYFTPTINLARDPRWGRSEESLSEDQFLTAQTAQAFVRGLQGDDEKYIKCIATAKAFTANNSEIDRLNGSMDMDMFDLREYYLYPFKQTVKNAQVQSIMTAYNAVNGVPMSANTCLIDSLLRNTWGFGGYIVTDCGGITFTYNSHKWDPDGDGTEYNPVTKNQAILYGLKSGNDLNCDWAGYNENIIKALKEDFTPNYVDNLFGPVYQSKVTVGDMERSLVRLFTARMKTGEFDPENIVAYNKLDASEIEAEDHSALALEASLRSVVLLKNTSIDGGNSNLLPVDPTKVNNVVVIGEFSDKIVLGDYSGSPTKTSTPVQGITKLLKYSNPNAKVHHIKSGDPGFFANIDYIDLLDAKGQVIGHIEAEAAAEVHLMKKEAKGLGYIKSNSYAKFNNINTIGVKSVRIRYAGPSFCPDAKIQIRYGNKDGAIVSVLETGATSSGGDWTTFKEVTSPYTGEEGGYVGSDPLYLVVSPKEKPNELSEEQKELVRNADYVFAFIGTAQEEQGENRDRINLKMENERSNFVKLLSSLNSKTIAYIQAVGQVDIEDFKDNVPAILWTTYNGQMQGDAAAKLLFGEVSPSGRLPFTWITDVDSELDNISNYNLRTPKGRTYQYFKGKVTYPFGYGLSYGDFKFSNLKLESKSINDNQPIQAEVNVVNNGNYPAYETVQLYITAPANSDREMPSKQLKSFAKVYLEPGETKVVKLIFNSSDLQFYAKETKSMSVPLGQYTIEIGKSANDPDACIDHFTITENVKPVFANLTIKADRVVFDETGVINTSVSAARQDETFYPQSQYEIVYSSTNTQVAVVDPKGLIKRVGSGSALIKASVTIDGITHTSSVPVSTSKEIIEPFQVIGGPGYPFTGSIDGDGYSIKNLKIESPKTNNIGFLGVTENAVVKNINFENVSVSGGANVGGIIGTAKGGELINCSVSGKILGEGNFVGGIIGQVDGAESLLLKNCYVNNMVKGFFAVGGLIGQAMNKTTVENCIAFSSVVADGRGGGLIGYSGDESLYPVADNSIKGNTLIYSSIKRNNSWSGENHFNRLVGTNCASSFANNVACDMCLVENVSHPIISNLTSIDGETTLIDKLKKKDSYLSRGYLFGDTELSPWAMSDDFPELWFLNEITTSLDNAMSEKCIVYPNPVKDLLKIRSEHQPDRYKIISSAGSLIRSNDQMKSSEINVSSLTAGTYYLILYTADKVSVESFIKK